jgi:hypothetical protein
MFLVKCHAILIKIRFVQRDTKICICENQIRLLIEDRIAVIEQD